MLDERCMMEYAAWDLVVVGAILGMAMRWLLRVNVQLHWAAVAGAAVMLLQPWVTMNVSTLVSSTSLPSVLCGGGVAAALFAAVQSINGH